MTSSLPPAPPPSLPEAPELPRRTRYRRPRRSISWIALFIGLLLGIGGGLYYAWEIAPIEETDTAPHQLRAEDKAQYVAAAMLRYKYDGDLDRAINTLVELNLGPDPIQAVADIACNLARTDYIDSNAGLNGVLAMMNFYRLQGRSGCADQIIPAPAQDALVITLVAPTPTATLPPPPTKTPTPPSAFAVSPTPTILVVPTTPPQRDFIIATIRDFCDSEIEGVIEVFVQDFNGDGIPGQAVRVRWDDGSNIFYTGLKPERGPAYADFQMTPNRAYIIDMPGRANPPANPLVADTCFTEEGIESLRSYRVVFRPAN